MRFIWMRGGRCMSCRRRWRLRRVARQAPAAPEPVKVRGRVPWTEVPDLDPGEVTRFDLIRRHPYL